MGEGEVLKAQQQLARWISIAIVVIVGATFVLLSYRDTAGYWPIVTLAVAAVLALAALGRGLLVSLSRLRD